MSATALQRLPDWPERLADYLAAMRPHRYRLGGNDCVRFAAGAAHATTGRHLLPVEWATPADVVRLLRRLGGVAAAVSSVLPELPSPALAQRGDLVLVQTPVHGGRAMRQWLAVVDGARWWVPSATGLASGPMHLARRAWGVGHG